VKSRPVFIALGFGLALLFALPVLLSQGLLNAAIQMLIAALFACAYNVLCGQAGMLSFGHAAYFGVGAFATIHAMNAFAGTGLLPTPLLPLAGALAGLVIGALAGWFATKRSGTYFAMITLAIAELLHSLAPHLKGLFGGEAGVSGMRMPSIGLTFGSTTQVYYLVLAWVLACLALLYFFTHTPLGRLALGLRENSHRLAFLGYDVHKLGVLVFAISAMFSGIAGGLQVVNNEAANYVVFDAALSASVVLNTYIGGTKAFLGPALGAALMTFFGYAVSDLTRSWLLYQGILFVLVMMFMPDGLAGLVAKAAALRRRHGSVAMLPVLLLSIAAGLACAAGVAGLIESLYRTFSPDGRAPVPALAWVGAIALLAAGGGLVWQVRRLLARLEGRTDTADGIPSRAVGDVPATEGGVA
jgi:branched-chain amino acid transport system permease protein